VFVAILILLIISELTNVGPKRYPLTYFKFKFEEIGIFCTSLKDFVYFLSTYTN